MQSCVSPVWDTGLCMTALLDAGVPPNHSALARAADWLLAKEVTRRGDWAVRAPRGTRPGGWSFEHENTWYPDVDDTCVVAMALSRLRGGVPVARQAACARATAWVLAMQSRSGGWAAFDVDNTRALWNAIPFADHGAMLDPPTPDITGRVLQLLGQRGLDLRHPAVLRALRFLRRVQQADGAFAGRWGVHTLYGTGIVVAGLRAVGVSAHHQAITRAVAFYVRAQNTDGGWGESCASYTDPAWRARGASTPSQTAWVVAALVAAGLATHPVTRGGVEWLCARQRPEGGWDESAYTGTGFPGHFYIRYHLYPDHFPLMALGRWLDAQGLSGVGEIGWMRP
jgi:squalene-hopene/tetraprenyl-beta-curcumene cyclase